MTYSTTERIHRHFLFPSVPGYDIQFPDFGGPGKTPDFYSQLAGCEPNLFYHCQPIANSGSPCIPALTLPFGKQATGTARDL